MDLQDHHYLSFLFVVDGPLTKYIFVTSQVSAILVERNTSLFPDEDYENSLSSITFTSFKNPSG